MSSAGLLYLDRLSDADLQALVKAAGHPAPPGRTAELRADPDRIPALIERPETFDAMFGAGADPGVLFASPHLAFSVLIARASHELTDVNFVREWVGRRRYVPLFDVAALRAFAEDRMRRLFLSDLLSSYTHVASGPVWIRSGHRWTRRRFSELDPIHLIRLIEATPGSEHAALYRRLGDLSLFLAGVFPDHAAGRLFGNKLARVERALGAGGSLEDAGGPIELLESLGRRSYEMVTRRSGSSPSGMAAVLQDVAQEFSQARRVLNFLTERHLFPVRDVWFGRSP